MSAHKEKNTESCNIPSVLIAPFFSIIFGGLHSQIISTELDRLAGSTDTGRVGDTSENLDTGADSDAASTRLSYRWGSSQTIGNHSTGPR